VLNVALSEAAAKTVTVPESWPAVSEDVPPSTTVEDDGEGAQAARPAVTAAAASSAAIRGFLAITRCPFPAVFQ